jgi:hypothetical protein
MPCGKPPAVGTVNSVMSPAVVMRPILPASRSVNQRFASDPVAMPPGELRAVGMSNSPVTTPAVVIRPILLPPYSVNQRLPSGPAAIRRGLR